MTESPATVPGCYRHPSRETYVRCARCDRPICPDCMRDAAVGHQCPECVAEGRRTQRPVRTAFGGGPAGREGYATLVLIGLNVLAALIGVAKSGSGALVGGGLFTGATWLHAAGAVTGPDWTLASNGDLYLGADPSLGDVFTGIDGGAYFRIVTGMFIHYGILHLLMNMYALWILGRNLEAALGPARFVALYLLSGIGGNVAAYLFSPGSLTAGASGAIFGLFAAFFLVLRKLGRDTSVLVPVLVINLIITFTVASISIEGHLGGLATGALAGAVLAYAPRTNRTLIQSAGCGGILIVLVLLTLLRSTAA